MTLSSVLTHKSQRWLVYRKLGGRTAHLTFQRPVIDPYDFYNHYFNILTN